MTIKFSIIDKDTLRIEQDAKVGDLINLSDTKNIQLDKNRLWELERQAKEQISESFINEKVKKQIKQVEESLRPSIELRIKKDYDKKIEQLNTENTVLKDQNTAKTITINELKRESYSSTKVMGEELEQWVLGQIEIAFSDNKNFKVKKDSHAIEGHMGDFIVEYSLDGNKVLSIMIECKTESNVSKATKSNKDHYAKLERDANNKQADFAILCSELEQKQDFSILPVKEYDNMYVVRPNSLISLLKTLISYVSNNTENINRMISLKKDNLSQEEFREQFINFASPIKKQIKWIVEGVKDQIDYGNKLIKMGNDMIQSVQALNKHADELENNLSEDNQKFKRIIKLLPTK